MKWLSDNKLNYLRSVVTEPDFSATKYTFTLPDTWIYQH